jgi:hypothetical protein
VDAAVEDVAVEGEADGDDEPGAENGDRDAGGVSSAVEFDVDDDGTATDGATAAVDGEGDDTPDEHAVPDGSATADDGEDSGEDEDEDIELDLKDPTE